MKWNEIHDPHNETEIRALFSGGVGKQFTPEEVQKLIDEHGVEAMVQTVNQHIPANESYSHLFLYTDNISGKKILTESNGSFS